MEEGLSSYKGHSHVSSSINGMVEGQWSFDKISQLGNANPSVHIVQLINVFLMCLLVTEIWIPVMDLVCITPLLYFFVTQQPKFSLRLKFMSTSIAIGIMKHECNTKYEWHTKYQIRHQYTMYVTAIEKDRHASREEGSRW